MDNFGSKLIKFALAIILVTLVVCAAYAAGFGSGYYAHGLVSSAAECARCPTAEPVTEGLTPRAPTTPGGTPPSPTEEEKSAFGILWEILSALREDYYGDLPSLEELASGAARGMLQTLDDQFTSYIEPKIARIINEDASGTFEGIGALVRMNEDNQLEIHRPFPGQPAEKAGVQASDVVIAVDGQSIVGLGLYEAIGLIRGPAGSKVTLTLVRAGVDQPFEVSITRARIDIPIVESKMISGDIAYVSLFEFSAPATQRMEAALKELLAQKPKGLILDLRDNPGGFLQQAVAVSDLFLPAGIIVIERTNEGQEQIFRATAKGIAQDIPMVVLVNSGSASASEIVAGALQDSGRARLIGEQTFGKGSVQSPRVLSNGAELRVTIARWFTPNDHAIHGQGLTPDMEIPLTADDARAGRDPQLDRAIDYLTTGQ